MKLVTCCSFKGGAGKTTALMGLCSSLAATGKTVALFEADENRPLSRWKQNALALDAWDDNCDVLVADDLAALEEAYGRAERLGFDYALADTHGGSSELNNTIIASSNFLLLPTMLSQLDIDETLATYRYIMELLIAEGIDLPTAILQQRVPIGRKTVSQETAKAFLDPLPSFDMPMRERDAFAAMKQKGMLHKTLEAHTHNPAMRLQMRNHAVAMEELHGLRAYVEHAIGE